MPGICWKPEYIIIKISAHPCYPINFDWFSWEWSKKNFFNFFFQNGRHKKTKIFKTTNFREIPKSHTTLSSYIWKLTDKKIPHFVNWSIKARGHAFSSGGRACNLCLTEKLTILTADQSTILNRRDEFLETCRHQRKHLLVSLFESKKPPDTTIKWREGGT